MGCLSTNSFLCCFSLRTGGIFLGAMGLLWSIVAALHMYRNGESGYCLAFVVLGFLFILWLDGIQYKKPTWMFPVVVVWVLTLWASIFGYAYCVYLYLTIPPQKFTYRNTHEYMLLALLIIVIIWDFAAISYSLYKNIKEERCRQIGISIVTQHHRMQPTIIPVSYPTIVSPYPAISPPPSAPYFTY